MQATKLYCVDNPNQSSDLLLQMCYPFILLNIGFKFSFTMVPVIDKRTT